ncbi:MAG: cobalamin biosynthesis protein CbiM, partial [Candidatus Neomarinimicrobiota bacterium]
MHMSDALISPAVGGTLWVAALAVSRRSARQVEHHQPEDLPLMGVAGAFVFAAQMINVSIPGTGSSGHLGGGLLLASLLGPEAAFLILFVVLFIQAVFFADGGLLALGCN